jgi:hypothetical protein
MAAADRHLLFGLLALQTGLIQQAQLVACERFHGGCAARPQLQCFRSFVTLGP